MSQGQVSEGQSGDSDARARTSGSPPLFLHIGRSHSGSSTIQSLAREYAGFMNAMGVACPPAADGTANHTRLATALQSQESDIEAIEKFRQDIRRIKRKKVFISAEALFNLKRRFMRRLKRHAGGREIRILCYIRDYPSWVQSLYGQRTKRGANAQDFDAFYNTIRGGVTALSGLERWAEVFGWETMHVRPLLPETLAGGDLGSDVLHALGVNALSPDVETRDPTQHWMSLELQRALAEAAQARSVAFDSRAATVTRRLFEEFTAGVEPRQVQYFTRDQWLELADLYRTDMEALGQHLGLSFPVNLTTPPERHFLPDLAHVAEKVKTGMLKHIGAPRHRTHLSPALIELLQEILSRKASDQSASRPD